MIRFSIVIPTHQRREVVARNVSSLQRQVERDFEVIVVDDGSSDGTAAALRQLDVPFPLTVIEQENRGAAAARNAGADVASGELLLFLDDDMEADPRMLAEHARSHAEGADVVVGDMPLHPGSPRNVLSWGVGLWAATRRRRLTAPGATLELGDLLTGQLSISRGTYRRLGGFDPSFTRAGLFGGEDTDFGHRVLSCGLRVVFNPEAISYQYYDVDPGEYLRRAREAGRSSHELLLKHPDQPERFGHVPGFYRRRDRWLLGPFAAAPGAASWPLRVGVAALARTGHTGPRLRHLFFAVRTMEVLRGLRIAQGTASTGAAVVLAYHAIADWPDDPVLRRYSVPAAEFARQLDYLAAKGWSFVDAAAILSAVAGERRLPRRAALVTFDDGYADFVEAALPVLRQRQIPAVVFVVAGLVGASNEWDRRLGARPIPLMSAQGLQRIASHGIEIGSHGQSHRSLADLEGRELASELRESAATLESLGLPRPRLFSYPYGETSREAQAQTCDAGYSAAFTVSPGVVGRGSNVFALPRTMVLRGYRPRILWLRLATARWRSERLDRLFGIVGNRVAPVRAGRTRA